MRRGGDEEETGKEQGGDGSMYIRGEVEGKESDGVGGLTGRIGKGMVNRGGHRRDVNSIAYQSVRLSSRQTALTLGGEQTERRRRKEPRKEGSTRNKRLYIALPKTL